MNNNPFIRKEGEISLLEMKDWDMLNIYSLFKKEYKDKESDKEMILAYANAINILAQNIATQNHGGNGVVAVFRGNSLTIPFAFLVRHTIELVLKHIIKSFDKIQKSGHDIKYLWKIVKTKIHEKDNGKSDDVLDGLSELIESIDSFDNDGTKVRYAHDKTGLINNDEPKFINVKNINEIMQEFVKFVEVDFGVINK